MGERSTRGLVTLLLLLVCTFCFAMFQGGFVSWFIFYAYLPVALLALIQIVFVLGGVTVKRELGQTHGQAGEVLEITLTVHNPYRLPLVYLTITDHLPEELIHGQDRVKRVVYPWFRRQLSVSYSIGPLKRGFYQWEKLVLATGDLFGLVKSLKEVTARQSLSVYPRYQRIERWETIGGKGWGQLVVQRYNQGEETPYVIGIRDYVAGDRMAQIHWKASARSSGLKSKEYERQTAHDVMLFLNQERRAYGAERDPLFERAVSLCASLAHYALSHRFHCGLYSAGHTTTVIPLKQGDSHLKRIFNHLVHVKADGRLPFAQGVARGVPHLPPGTHVVLITPVLDRSLFQLMVDLKYRQMRAELFLVKRKRPTKEEEAFLTQLNRLNHPFYLIDSDRFPSRLARRETDGREAAHFPQV